MEWEKIPITLYFSHVEPGKGLDSLESDLNILLIELGIASHQTEGEKRTTPKMSSFKAHGRETLVSTGTM